MSTVNIATVNIDSNQAHEDMVAYKEYVKTEMIRLGVPENRADYVDSLLTCYKGHVDLHRMKRDYEIGLTDRKHTSITF